MSTTSAATVLAVIQAVGAVTRITLARLSDHWQRRITPMRTVALLSAVGLALLAALSSSAPLAVLLPVLVVFGAVAMSWNGLDQGAVLEFVPLRRAGAALGVLNTSVAFSAGVSAPVLSAVVAVSSWTVGLGTLAAPALAAALLLRPLHDDPKR
jgi:MFS family permease